MLARRGDVAEVPKAAVSRRNKNDYLHRNRCAARLSTEYLARGPTASALAWLAACDSLKWLPSGNSSPAFDPFELRRFVSYHYHFVTRRVRHTRIGCTVLAEHTVAPVLDRYTPVSLASWGFSYSASSWSDKVTS
jgi:hypothetical protein